MYRDIRQNQLASIAVSVLLHVIAVALLLSVKSGDYSGGRKIISVFISTGDSAAGVPGPPAASGKDHRRMDKSTGKAIEENHETVQVKKEAFREAPMEPVPEGSLQEAHEETMPDPAAEAVPVVQGGMGNDESAAGPDHSVAETPADETGGRGSAPKAAVAGSDYEGDVYIGGFGRRNGPRFMKQVMPRYPLFARRTGREGRVVLRLFIDEEGRLLDVEVVERAGFGFDESALEAVRMSTFLPAVKDGRPVKSRILLPVRFVLEQ